VSTAADIIMAMPPDTGGRRDGVHVCVFINLPGGKRCLTCDKPMPKPQPKRELFPELSRGRR